MGECGCGDGFGLWQFPGPDGTVYAFDVYYGCEGCSNPIGIAVHRYKGEALEMCPVESNIETMPWRTPGLPRPDNEDDWGYSCVMPPLVDPETLAKDLIEAVGDVECTADGESYKLSELLEEQLMYEVIGKNMERTFCKWMAAVRDGKV